MKALVFSLISFAASFAIAFPAVNDKAVFNGLVEGAAGGQIEFTQTLEVISIDAAAGKAKVKNSLALPNGRVQNQELDLELGDLLTVTQIRGILAQCAVYGGTLANTVVAAGTFQTCELKQDGGGVIFIAEVPFGFVKQVGFDEDQNKITTELGSFVEGK